MKKIWKRLMVGNKKKVKEQYVMCDLDQCEKVKQLEIQLAEAQQWIDSEPDWKDQYMKRYMALQDWVKQLEIKLRAVCLHQKTHNEDWPDGGRIEVCDDCGMSRWQWEQGDSPWTMVEDIPKARKELEEQLEGIRKNIKFEEGGRIGIDSDDCIGKGKGEKV